MSNYTENYIQVDGAVADIANIKKVFTELLESTEIELLCDNEWSDDDTSLCLSNIFSRASLSDFFSNHCSSCDYAELLWWNDQQECEQIIMKKGTIVQRRYDEFTSIDDIPKYLSDWFCAIPLTLGWVDEI